MFIVSVNVLLYILDFKTIYIGTISQNFTYKAITNTLYIQKTPPVRMEFSPYLIY